MTCSRKNAATKAAAFAVAAGLCLRPAPAHAGFDAVLSSATRLVLVYPAGWAKSAAKTDQVRRIADYFRAHGLARVDLVSDREATASELMAGTLYALGSPADNRVLRNVAPRLPVHFDRKGFVFEGKRYGPAQSLLLALPPSPGWRQGVLLDMGSDFAAVISVSTAPVGDWDYLVASKDVVDRQGTFAFSRSGEILGPSYDQDFDAVRKDYALRLLTRTTPHFVFHYLPGTKTAADIEQLTASNESMYAQLSKAFSYQFTRPISYYLYESTDQEHIVTGIDDNAWCDSDALSIHAVYSQDLDAVGYHEPVHLFAEAAWGEPGTRLMDEGLAVSFDGTWWDKPLAYWGGTLERDQRVPSLDVLAHDQAYWAAHSADGYALAGDFVSYLRKDYTMAQVRALYLSHFTPPEVQAIYEMSWRSFEKRWNKELAREAKSAGRR